MLDRDLDLSADAKAIEPHAIAFTQMMFSHARFEREVRTLQDVKLKNGQGLMVQAVISGGPEIRFVLPLFDFKKAYEGSPSDPKLFE
jgi:hypothetical protein